MYARDATAIQAHVAQGGAPAFRDVVVFVLATIRIPLWAAVDATRDILDAGERAADAKRRTIWGSKRAGFAFIDDEHTCAEVYKGAREAADAGDVAALLETLTAIPGIGLAKAGFIAQLAFGLSGCLDTHNLTRFGLAASVCSIGTSKVRATRLKRAKAYADAVEQAGGTASLWDSWCNYVAANQPGRYFSGDHVSLLHCTALGLEPAH